MDLSHIALLDVYIPKSSLGDFEYKTEFFGIRINDFKNAIDTAGNEDLVQLKIESQDNMHIDVSGSLKMEYHLRLLDKALVNVPIPKFDTISEAIISVQALLRIVTNVEKFSEFITIKATKNEIEFTGKGDIGNARMELETFNPDLELLKATSDNSCTYGLEYLGKIVKSLSRVCSKCHIKFGNDTPLYLLFELPSMTKIFCYLAPKAPV